MKEAYDIALHNTEEGNYAREDGFAAVREVLEENLSSRYTLDEELSDTQVLVFEDAETGKGVLVFRGANAGPDETESGQEANARDQQSFKGAFTNPKHNEVSLCQRRCRFGHWDGDRASPLSTRRRQSVYQRACERSCWHGIGGVAQQRLSKCSISHGIKVRRPQLSCGLCAGGCLAIKHVVHSV